MARTLKEIEAEIVKAKATAEEASKRLGQLYREAASMYESGPVAVVVKPSTQPHSMSQPVKHPRKRHGKRQQLTDDAVRMIRLELSKGARGADLARQFGCDPSTITKIKNKEAYANVQDFAPADKEAETWAGSVQS